MFLTTGCADVQESQAPTAFKNPLKQLTHTLPLVLHSMMQYISQERRFLRGVEVRYKDNTYIRSIRMCVQDEALHQCIKLASRSAGLSHRLWSVWCFGAVTTQPNECVCSR